MFFFASLQLVDLGNHHMEKLHEINNLILSGFANIIDPFIARAKQPHHSECLFDELEMHHPCSGANQVHGHLPSHTLAASPERHTLTRAGDSEH